MLAGEAVVRVTLATFEQSASLPFGDRLISSLNAGEAAGGDKRGKTSAGINPWLTEPSPLPDLRAPRPALQRMHATGLLAHLPGRFAYTAMTATACDRIHHPGPAFEWPADAPRRRLYLLALLRVAKRRFLAQKDPLDILLAFLLASMISRPITVPAERHALLTTWSAIIFATRASPTACPASAWNVTCRVEARWRSPPA